MAPRLVSALQVLSRSTSKLMQFIGTELMRNYHSRQSTCVSHRRITVSTMYEVERCALPIAPMGFSAHMEIAENRLKAAENQSGCRKRLKVAGKIRVPLELGSIESARCWKLQKRDETCRIAHSYLLHFSATQKKWDKKRKERLIAFNSFLCSITTCTAYILKYIIRDR